MDEEKQSKIQDGPKDTMAYRGIFKATSLFGGVQVFQILISIIKSKIIAVLLGPAGVGIQGLYQSAILLIQGVTSMGLSSSAVRDVSESYASEDGERVSFVLSVLRKLVWGTGLLGMVAVVVLSPLLSKATFGNYDYTIPFILLSIILLLDQIFAGQKVVLQGMRKLKYLAKASAIGSTVGLIVSIPLYYWLGVKGIIPTLILNSASSLLLSWYFSKKVKIDRIVVSNKQAFQEGKSMLKMGLSMSFSSIMVYAGSYIIRGFIRYKGGLDEVGLFNAGFAIMATYTGMVFTAMSTDYYPRIAGVNKDNNKCNDVVNQQSEIAVLILAPLISIGLIFLPLMITLLYSDKFIGANDYIIWAALGMMFKVISWAIAFIFIAKGEARLFLINEFSANTYTLLLNVAGYYIMGLKGLGISFAITYFIYMIQVYIISKKRYSFSFSKSLIKIYMRQLLLVVSCLLCVFFLRNVALLYVIGSFLVILSSLYSLYELNQKMDLRQIIKKFSKRY